MNTAIETNNRTEPLPFLRVTRLYPRLGVVIRYHTSYCLHVEHCSLVCSLVTIWHIAVEGSRPRSDVRNDHGIH